MTTVTSKSEMEKAKKIHFTSIILFSINIAIFFIFLSLTIINVFASSIFVLVLTTIFNLIFLGTAITTLVFGIFGTIYAFKFNQTTPAVLYIIGLVILPIVGLIGAILAYKKIKNENTQKTEN